ncbi:MAG: electron transfer flavoprotein subunit beta/FixA family protein [Bacteroidetes bacterium]|nr:electron transfer flavoprotein subunit beta/FixA family protein [Bacteroidota bacterium]
MKLLVCISKAPDTTTKISFTDNNTKFNEAGVQYIVNPYDEWYALVRALEIKEALGGSVTIITVGPVADEAIIRKALAIGADEAVRIDAEPTGGLFVAKQIAAYAKDKGFDLILTGKETIDYNGSQVPGMLAELLDQPFISQASKLDMNGNKATLEIDIPGGSEVVEVETPFVVSCAKGMAEARIPNMRGIMAARTKPLNVVPAVEASKNTIVKQYSLPPEKKGCKMIPAEQAEQLIDLLHNEAKAI